MKKINKSSVGDNYFKLLKYLPFNTSYKNVNLIIHRFIKSEAKDGAKSYIAKIYQRI